MDRAPRRGSLAEASVARIEPSEEIGLTKSDSTFVKRLKLRLPAEYTPSMNSWNSDHPSRKRPLDEVIVETTTICLGCSQYHERHDECDDLRSRDLVVWSHEVRACNIPERIRSNVYRSLKTDPDTKDDIVQEVLIKLFETIQSEAGVPTQPRRGFKWLDKVVAHKIVDHLRNIGAKKRASIVYLGELVESQRDYQIDQLSQLLFSEKAKSCIDMLRKNCRPRIWSAVLWHYVHGEPVKQVAKKLNMSWGKLYQELRQVRASFENCLNEGER